MILLSLLNPRERLAKRAKEEADAKAERIRREQIRQAKESARTVQRGYEAVTAHGIGAAYRAAEGKRHIKPADVLAPCPCGDLMVNGQSHYCLPPHTPLVRSAL